MFKPNAKITVTTGFSNFYFFNFIILFYVCMCLLGAEEGIRTPGTRRVRDSCGFWEPSLGSLQEQQ